MYVKVKTVPPENGWSLFGEFERVEWNKDAYVDDSGSDQVFIMSPEDRTWITLKPDVVFINRSCRDDWITNSISLPTDFPLIKKIIVIKGYVKDTLKTIIATDSTVFTVSNKGETIERIR